LSAFTTTNPEHVFEIHPILRVGKDSIPDSWVPITGYTPKVADDAFTNYENRPSHIRVSADGKTTTITTTMGGYNYVEFKLVVNGPQNVASDGRFVMAEVLDMSDDLLVRNR